MEITIDIGGNVVKQLQDIAYNQGKEMEIVALDLLDIGLRVQASSSKNSSDDGQQPVDDTLKLLTENNLLCREILASTFNKSCSKLKVLNADTAINILEKMAASYLKGKQEKS